MAEEYNSGEEYNPVLQARAAKTRAARDAEAQADERLSKLLAKAPAGYVPVHGFGAGFDESNRYGAFAGNPNYQAIVDQFGMDVEGDAYIPQYWMQQVVNAENQKSGSIWTNGPLQLFSALLGGMLAPVPGAGITSTAGIEGLGEFVPSYLAEGGLAAGIPGLSEVTPTLAGTAGTAGGAIGAVGAEPTWWEIGKQALETFSNVPLGGELPAAGIAAGVAAGTDFLEPSAEPAAPAIEDVPLPAAPKPGAPDYKSLWQSYSGWIDNVNRINEGAFADVRARLSAAGAAPDLIKMQTEHLESQRVSAVEDLNKSSTFGLLQEGYDIAVGGAENRYEGGLSRYAGEGKPALMDFYTELYGQPTRAGVRGSIGTGGLAPSASQAGIPNPWLDDAGRMSLIG